MFVYKNWMQRAAAAWTGGPPPSFAISCHTSIDVAECIDPKERLPGVVLLGPPPLPPRTRSSTRSLQHTFDAIIPPPVVPRTRLTGGGICHTEAWVLRQRA